MSAFERQREDLIREIALGMEAVLQNINRLNRNLESIITVGNEFNSVEALWSQFENFIGRQGESATTVGAGNSNSHHEGSGSGNANTENDDNNNHAND